MADWIKYVEQAVEHKSSDIFFIAGGPVCEKREGVICHMSDSRLLPADTESIVRDIYKVAERDINAFISSGDDDFSFALPGVARFRVNAYTQRGSMAAVIRVVSFAIPDHKEMGLGEDIMSLAQLTSGMILVTGTAGSGKSTTQACLIDRINRTRSCHIVTLEDPIEYLHRHQKSIVSQREIAIDTTDCLSALRACLRQAPDVILLGELRDAETIHTAMTAAETGHLVIATLHTKGAVNVIDRVIDAFPSAQQTQARYQLSTVLQAVVSQQLIPGVDGQQLPACEIMLTNNAIRTMIRDGKIHQIESIIAQSGKEGMISMDQSLASLYRDGKIHRETAMAYADHPESLARILN